MDATNADTTDELTHTLTRGALEELPGYSADDYDEHAPYGNPLTDATHGQSYNWTRNLLPNNTVDFIRQFDDLAEGIARTVEMAFESLYEYSPRTASADIPKGQVIGAIKAIVARFGVGAAGERYFAQTVDLVERKRGDESRGIDVRTSDKTYQVKTADSRRSDWDKKQADELVWVEVAPDWHIHRDV